MNKCNFTKNHNADSGKSSATNDLRMGDTRKKESAQAYVNNNQYNFIVQSGINGMSAISSLQTFVHD